MPSRASRNSSSTRESLRRRVNGHRDGSALDSYTDAVDGEAVITKHVKRNHLEGTAGPAGRPEAIGTGPERTTASEVRATPKATRRLEHKEPPTRSIIVPIPSHPQLTIITTPLSRHPHDPRLISDPVCKHKEYRIENWRQLPSGRILRGDNLGLLPLLISASLIGLSIYFARQAIWHFAPDQGVWGIWYPIFQGARMRVVLTVMGGWFLVFALLKSLFSVVLYQSVITLPSIGIQLETTSGFSIPILPLAISAKSPFPPRNTSSQAQKQDPRHEPPRSRLLIPLSTAKTFIPLSQISTVIINEGLSRWNVRYYLGVIKRDGEVVVAFDNLRQPSSVLKEVYHGIREDLFDEYAIALE